MGSELHVRCFRGERSSTRGYVKIRNDSNAAYTFNHNPYPILCDAYPNGACGKPGGIRARDGALLLERLDSMTARARMTRRANAERPEAR